MSDEGPFDTPALTRLVSGTCVGEYLIEAVIGRGGMGTVYRAVHPLIGKKVAVKVLKGSFAKDTNFVQRFILEARAVNEIRHRNLVDIFSLGQLADGRYYYVMEYLEGQSLRQLLDARRRVPTAEVLPVFIDVAHALVATHAKSIVHRDLKPDNVFLASQGGAQTVKLLDFGLAKVLEGSLAGPGGPKTAHGSTLGTPHYMSPEQCRGQDIDGRTDIYALGVMLYEAVTGTVPLDGRSALEICYAQVRKQPPRAIERAPDAVSTGLDRIIMKMLCKDRADRFPDAGAVRMALESLLPARTTETLRGLPTVAAVVGADGDADTEVGLPSAPSVWRL